MRVLVCGGRDFGNTVAERYFIFNEIDELCLDGAEDVIIAGKANGVDTIAEEYAEQFGIPFLGFPADWNTYGKRAGFIRNTQMLNEGKPDLVLAFPGGKGTAMMVEIAAKAGVEVWVIEEYYE